MESEDHLISPEKGIYYPSNLLWDWNFQDKKLEKNKRK